MTLKHNEFLPLVMKQRYKIDSDGKTTTIPYCIQEKHHAELVFGIEYYRTESSFLHFSMTPEININEICNLNKNDPLEVRSEGQFFVKTSSYNNKIELNNARQLAIEDDIRFKLISNTLNATSCPEIEDSFSFMNLIQTEFLQKFILESQNIYDIYLEQITDIPTTDSLLETALSISVEAVEAIEGKDNNVISFAEASQWIDKMLEMAISKNTNVKFTKLNDCSDASLIMTPNLSPTGAAGEELFYSKNQIIKLFNSFPVAVNNTGWSEGLHGVIHSFIDHPCENGFYSCNKKEILDKGYIPSILSQQYGVVDDTNNFQSLLPWDLAALRYSYGTPETANNIYYNLSSALGLKEAFGYVIGDKSIVTLSSVGNIILDIKNVNNYALDLHYDHKSYVTNSDIEMSFYISYDTSISEILVNNSGSITLNDEFQTNIMIYNQCYTLVSNGDGYQNDVIIQSISDDCTSQSAIEIDLYNFDSSLHSLYLGDGTAIAYIE